MDGAAASERGEELRAITELPSAPARPAEGHKGTFGTVIVVGGSETMPGAPAICARAAFRCGSGLVKVAASRGVLPGVLMIEPSATGVLLAWDVPSSLEAIEEADPSGRAVVAIGPGLGTGELTGVLMMALLLGRRGVVLDADGLSLLATTGERAPHGRGPLVLTPHPGEFRRLAEPLGIPGDPTSDDDRPGAAAALARAHEAVVVLKGRRTVVTDGRALYVNQSGNVALATAGSGDVLTGVIASLMGQGMSPLDAAVLGTHVHGAAADAWAAEFGDRGMLARELADRLPVVVKQLRRSVGC
jgi:ADP-dependent NAD(P)H-hydrate dehydratase